MNKFLTLFTVLILAGAFTANAQFARLQVIHNAADPSAATVDVYVNGGLFIDDFNFRDATAFGDVPASVQLTIGVAPGNSTGPGDIIASFPFNLAANGTFVLVANGVLNTANFAANPDAINIAFNLYALTGQESASSGVDVNIFHGSTDAPTVDVRARFLGENPVVLADDLAYGVSTGYLNVPEDVQYLLDVMDETGTTTVATFSLNTDGLGGGAAVVLASGFLTPSANQNGPAFGLLAVFPDGSSTLIEPAEYAFVQVIHNSADPVASVIDVYLNSLQQDAKFNDFNFREASAYVAVEVNTTASICLNDPTSTGPANQRLFNPILIPDGTLAPNTFYTVFADGLTDTSAFAPNPDGEDLTFGLFLGPGQVTAPAGNVSALLHHGSTDAPTVDIVVRNDGSTLVNDFTYGDIIPYTNLPAATYYIDVYDETGVTKVKSYRAQVGPLAGNAAVIFASGFFNPAANNNGPAFGLFAALPDGTVIALPELGIANVQVIHNSADPAAEVVDIYVTDGFTTPIKLDDVAFHTATGFLELESIIPLTIGVAPSTSGSIADTIFSNPAVGLQTDVNYVIIANGVLNPAGFAANPDGESTAFNLFIYTPARQVANDPQKADINVFHGATDAPTVDVTARVGATGTQTTLVDNAAYGDFTGYLEVDVTDYILAVKEETGTTTVAEFSAPLGTATGAAATVYASGFLDPAQNGNGEPFGLWATIFDGTTFPLPLYTSVREIRNISGVTVYPNPSADFIQVNYNLTESDRIVVNLVDAKGAIVLSNDFGTIQPGSNNLSLGIAELPSANYLVSIQVGNHTTVTQPIIKK